MSRSNQATAVVVRDRGAQGPGFRSVKAVTEGRESRGAGGDVGSPQCSYWEALDSFGRLQAFPARGGVTPREGDALLAATAGACLASGCSQRLFPPL